jgi:hypothetical protein
MLDRFKSAVRTLGLARSNRYEVLINFPQSISGTSELTNLFCEVTGLPGYSVATNPHKIFGESREIPYEPMYEPITLTFYSDSNMQIKDAFETWMSKIINPITRTHGYYDDYVSTIGINVVNIDGSIPYMVQLFEAYPKMIQTVPMSQSDTNMMRINVGMVYKYWRSTSLTSYARYVPPVRQSGADTTGISTGAGDFSIQGNSGYGR